MRAAVVAWLASFALAGGLFLFYPYGAAYGEAPLLDQATAIVAGHPIYKPSFQTPPYAVANYPPVYPALVGIAATATRLPLYLTGRALSLLAAVGSSVLLGSIAARVFGSRRAGWLSAAMFLGHPDVTLWSGLARVDSVALAFALAGLWLVLFRWRSWFYLTLAVVCLLAGIFTRQTQILAAPLASTIWLLRNDRRRGFAFAAMLISTGLALFLALDVATDGGAYRHLVLANVNEYSLKRLMDMSVLLVLTGPLLFVASARSLREAPLNGGNRLLRWGLVPYTAGTLISGLAVGKIGSDVNYFMELVGAASIWAAGAWATRPLWVPRSVLLVHAAWTVLAAALLVQVPLVRLWNRLPAMTSLAHQVQTAVQHGPVLADERLDLVVLSNQSIYFQPFEYTQLLKRGLWDPAPFLREIEARKFPLIMVGTAFREERWPAPVLAAIRQQYACIPATGMLVCKP